MNIESTLELIAKLKGNESDLCHYMTHSFIREMVDYDSYDENAVLYDEDLIELIANILKDFGADTVGQLLASSTEFVITNYYPMPGQEKLWNCIDYMLTKYKKSIKADDAAYLQGLNNSYMSIYEVLDITPGESITLLEMIGTNKSSIIVKECIGSKQLSKQDVIGVRVVNNGKELVLSSIILPLSRNLSEHLIAQINFITEMMSKSSELRMENKAMGINDEAFELQIQKLWAKEIVSGWFSEL